eukprot:365188-Chlamydomonas_euryale.AAC.12
MRLDVKTSASGVHTDLVGAVGWNVWGEAFSVSDDQTVRKWNGGGEPEGQVRCRGRGNGRAIAATRYDAHDEAGGRTQEDAHSHTAFPKASGPRMCPVGWRDGL